MHYGYFQSPDKLQKEHGYISQHITRFLKILEDWESISSLWDWRHYQGLQIDDAQKSLPKLTPLLS